MEYGYKKQLNLSYETALQKVITELKKEGFGIPARIDVKALLKEKLGVDFDKYIILGACNPPFAHKALQAEENIGLLLPCNVVVYEKGNQTIVGAFDPMSMTTLVDNPSLQAIAQEVKARLFRVVEAL